MGVLHQYQFFIDEEQANKYVNAPFCHVNLLELSRYAKQCDKKLVELTKEEVKKFSI